MCFNCTETIPTPTSIGGGARVPGAGGRSCVLVRFIMYSLRAAVEASRTKALKSAPLKMVFDIVLTKCTNLLASPFFNYVKSVYLLKINKYRNTNLTSSNLSC